MLKKSLFLFAGLAGLILAANFARGWQSVKGQISGAATINVGSAAGGGGRGCGGAAQLPCATGWYQIPNTSWSSLCPGAQVGTCAAVAAAWNSGVADTKRNRLIFTGGGHSDYSGNEIYYLDLNNLTMNRLTNADPPNAGGTDTDASGNPNQVHTYGGLAYIPSTDQMYRHGGALYPTGDGTTATWLFNFSGNIWTHKDPLSGTPTTGDCCNYQTFGDYDPQTDLVWYVDDAFLWTYNAHTNTQTQISNLPFEIFPNSHVNCAIDYLDRYMFCFGDGVVGRADLAAATPTFSDITSSTSGCGALTNFATNPYVGLAFDPVQDRVISWIGGSGVTSFNPATLACTVNSSFTGGPGAAQANGTFGRWRYFPALGAFALVNAFNQNAYALRMTAYSASLNDFESRCATPGVIVCQGFDDAGGIPRGNNTGGPGSGAQPDSGSGTNFPTQDTSTVASGAGSMRFDIPTPSGIANPEGYWLQNFQARLAGKAATSKLFGPGSTFYVQYKQRMTAAYISNTWGGSFFKQSIISPHQYTCGAMEFTTVNSFSKGFPEAYFDCGANGLAIDLGNGDFLLEQGSTVGGTTIGSGGTYNCHYQGPNTSPNLCFLYPANTWVTYTFRVVVGTNGTPTTTFQAWATAGGQSYAGNEWLNMTGQAVTMDEPGYDMVTLLPYWTGGYSGASGPATTWYDELIVSAQPIAAPGN